MTPEESERPGGEKQCLQQVKTDNILLAVMDVEPLNPQGLYIFMYVTLIAVVAQLMYESLSLSHV